MFLLFQGNNEVSDGCLVVCLFDLGEHMARSLTLFYEGAKECVSTQSYRMSI